MAEKRMKITMAALFWLFMITTIFGMLLQHMSIGAAMTAFGLGGIAFVALMFITWLRDGENG